MKPTSSPALAVVVVAGTLALATPARAQDIAAAEALFNRGLADMEAGRYELGCKAIAESQRIDPRPGTLFTLATCEERWGHIATAVTRYGDYLLVFDRLPEDRKAAQGLRPATARARREKLAPEVPELTVVLPPGAPRGTQVRRDGQPMAEAALGVSLPVDPGEHVIATEAPGGAVWEQQITIARGDKKKITLAVRTAAAASPNLGGGPANLGGGPGPTPAGPSARRVASYAVGGVGLAALVAGGVLGGIALQKKGVVDQHCGSGIGAKDPKACDETGLDAVNGAKALGTGSTIGFAVGLAGVGTGLGLLLTDLARPAPAKGARGPWITPRVAAGPGGIVVGAGAVW